MYFFYCQHALTCIEDFALEILKNFHYYNQTISLEFFVFPRKTKETQGEFSFPRIVFENRRETYISLGLHCFIGLKVAGAYHVRLFP